jgi:hypothetical protein
MKRSDAFPAKFLKAADVEDGDITATISSVEQEAVGQDKTIKSVLYFRGQVKPLILNGTNWDTIVKITGEGDSDNWEGKRIVLYSTEVQFGNKMVDAIRVRAPKAAQPVKAAPDPAESDGYVPPPDDAEPPDEWFEQELK